MAVSDRRGTSIASQESDKGLYGGVEGSPSNSCRFIVNDGCWASIASQESSSEAWADLLVNNVVMLFMEPLSAGVRVMMEQGDKAGVSRIRGRV